MTTIRLRYLLLLLLLPALLNAQKRLLQPEMYVGVHGGAIASLVSFTPTVNGTSNLMQTVLLGGNGGAVFRYSGQKCCGLQVELNYMQRGWRESFAATDSTEAGRYTRRLQFIELPFLMHIYFGNERGRGFVNLGPQIGYCISDNWSGTQQKQHTQQYQKIYYPFDWGIAAGLGAYYRSKNAGVFQLEARFDFSFSDTFYNDKKAFFDSSHSLNLSLNLAYLWEIKRR